MSISLLKLLFATSLASMAIPPSWLLTFLKINPLSLNRLQTFNKSSPRGVSVGKEHQEEHVQNHEDSEHEEGFIVSWTLFISEASPALAAKLVSHKGHLCGFFFS